MPYQSESLLHGAVTMRSYFLSLLVVIFAALTPPAHADSLDSSDKAAITAVIEDQLKAFARDDGPAAYAHAAPIVTSVFPTVEGFMAMVKGGYAPIYRNSSHSFEDLTTDSLGRPAQRVQLRGMDGKTYEARYSMEKQPDGTWKIAGVSMLALPGTEV